MIHNCFYVMCGGALGALSRYLVATACTHVRVLSLPIGTFVVNVVGCFLLGFFAVMGEQCTSLPRPWLLLFTVGFCGSFTTFSTLTSELYLTTSAGQLWHALLYLAASVVVGFALFVLGRTAALQCFTA